jgi:hypothetical protein
LLGNAVNGLLQQVGRFEQNIQNTHSDISQRTKDAYAMAANPMPSTLFAKPCCIIHKTQTM